MFNTTLRYLNLIILPHPSFDVPLSEPDPVFRIHGRKEDNDTTYISQNQISQFGPIGFSTPRKPVLNAKSHERRRNTVCCYSCHCLADPFPAKEDIPTWPVNISFNSFLSSDTSKHNPFQENIPTPSASTGSKIQTATSHDPSSPSSSWSGQPRIASFVNFSNSSDDRVAPEVLGNKRKNSRYLARKGKKKRNSAPPAVSLKHKDQFSLQNSRVIDITSTNESIEPPDTSQSLPTVLRKDLRQKSHANLILPYTSKHFEIGLSPIIEDTHIFSNTFQAPKNLQKNVEIKPTTTDTLDSSGSSYGELIQTIDYLSTSEYETFRMLEWENPERSKHPEPSGYFDTQSYADHRGDRYWSDEFWQKFEDSSLIPELTLTVPTPEMGISVKFRSEDRPGELSCDHGLDYQGPEANFAPETANACRPNRLGYTTALASISKALGTGADMLLGVGNGVFDDMLDTGVVCSTTSRLPMLAVAHPEIHLNNGWPGSLTTQSLGNGQTEIGFLGQLLRRKSTGRSKMSEGRGRVWKRVSHILQSSRRSSRSARGQEESIAPAGPLKGSHTANGPLNASHGWKRFSRIFAHATVSSRRKSTSDQPQFIDPLQGERSGFSDFGSTRRYGLDISAERVGERWYGSSSPGTATREYINEKHTATHLDKPSDASRNIGTSRNWYGNLFGADAAKPREPRRHSFGIGKKISKPLWHKGPGSSIVNWGQENPEST